MSRSNQQLLYVFTLALIVFLPLILSAAPEGGSVFTDIGEQLGAAGDESGLAKGKETGSIGDVTAGIIQAVLGLLGTIAVILLVYGGFLWMTAGGNEENVEKAKTMLRNAIIGLVIILLAYSITRFVIKNVGKATGVTVQDAAGGGR